MPNDLRPFKEAPPPPSRTTSLGTTTSQTARFAQLLRSDTETLKKPSFTDHTFPILDRLDETQWVDQGFFMLFGRDVAGELTTTERLKRLTEHRNTRRTTLE
jgi:hypothetical protein